MKFFNDYLYPTYKEEANEGGDPGSSDGDPAPAPDPAPADPPVDPAPSWVSSAPDNWRDELAGGDESRGKKLARYTSVGSFIDSAFEAHEAARKGTPLPQLSENPTEEEVVEYRTAKGLPADGEYRLQLADGLELNENDQEIMNSVLPVALKAEIPTEAMNEITSAFVAARDAQISKILSQDSVDKQNAEQTLRGTWGADYDTNMTMVNNLVSRLLPSEDLDAFKNGRDADGRSLLSNPAVVNMLATIERTINPMSTIPGGQENAGSTARQIIDKAKEYQKSGEGYPSKDFENQYLKAIEYMQSVGEKI